MTRFAEREFDDTTLKEYERELLAAYPFIKKEVIGYSLLHKELCAYCIGEGGALFAAVFHGAERVTGAILTRYLFEKAEAVKRGEKVSFTAIPLINPDGARIALYGADAAERYMPLVRRLSGGDTTCWQANARGVDLNHNFNAGRIRLRENEIRYGFVTRGPTRFGGEAPESEPEAAALCAYGRRKSFSLAAALHSQGREIYYDFESSAPESLSIALKMARLSGYSVSAPSDTAIGGGFKDWFCRRFRSPGFTIEVGMGENPLPKETADTEYDRVKPMLDLLLSEGMKTASRAKGG